MKRLICPNCGCSYEVPAELLAGSDARPKKFRCRVCATVFTAAIETAPIEQDSAASERGPVLARPVPAREAPARRRRAVAAPAAAVALGLALGLPAGGLTALLLRPDLAQALAADTRLPPLARQAVARLPAAPLPAASLPAFLRPVSPLRFEVASRLDLLPDGGTALRVAGEIVNPTAWSTPVPALELRLVDASGRTLERREVRAPATAIPAGGRIRFATVALDPPPEATGARLAAGGALLDPL